MQVKSYQEVSYPAPIDVTFFPWPVSRLCQLVKLTHLTPCHCIRTNDAVGLGIEFVGSLNAKGWRHLAFTPTVIGYTSLCLDHSAREILRERQVGVGSGLRVFLW